MAPKLSEGGELEKPAARRPSLLKAVEQQQLGGPSLARSGTTERGMRLMGMRTMTDNSFPPRKST